MADRLPDFIVVDPLFGFVKLVFDPVLLIFATVLDEVAGLLVVLLTGLATELWPFMPLALLLSLPIFDYEPIGFPVVLLVAGVVGAFLTT